MHGASPSMNELLKQAQQMQHTMVQAQEELARASVTGDAGGGLVRATVSGTGELLGLALAPEALDPDDPETLADMIVAAVRAAQDNAQQLAQTTLAPLAGGLPGLGTGLGL